MADGSSDATDDDILLRAVRAAQAQSTALRAQLAEIANEIDATREYLAFRAAEDAAGVQQAAAFSQASQPPSAAAVLARGSQDNIELPSVGATDLVALRELEKALSQDLDKLAVSRVLHGLDMNRARPDYSETSIAASARYGADRHPQRVTIFAGPNASLSCVFNVDHTTTFAQLLKSVCEFWEVDCSEYVLLGNGSRESDTFHALEYQDRSKVVAALEKLKFDSSMGFGCNGLTNSPFAELSGILPPVYLVSRFVPGLRPAEETAAQFREDRVDSIPPGGIRHQALLRLYMAQHRAEIGRPDAREGFIRFEQFVNVVDNYFSGSLIASRSELSKMFSERAKILFTSAEPSGELMVNLAICTDLVLAIAASYSSKSKALEGPAEASSTTPHSLTAPQRVYAWMCSFAEDQSPGETHGAAEETLLTFPAFQDALFLARPSISSADVNSVWHALIGTSSASTLARKDFLDKWLRVANGAKHTNDDDTLHSVVMRAVEQSEVDDSDLNLVNERQGTLRTRFRHLLISSIWIIVALTLAYLLLFLGYRAGQIAELRLALQDGLLGKSFSCLNASYLVSEETAVVDEDGVPSISSRGQRHSFEAQPSITFSRINSLGCIWGFLNEPLRALVYEDSDRESPRVMSYSLLVPANISFRQIRSGPTSCSEVFTGSKNCVSEFAPDDQDQALAFAPKNSTPLTGIWNVSRYASAFTLSPDDAVNMDPVQGRLATYSSNGFIFQFQNKIDDSDPTRHKRVWAEDLINLLKLQWIDRYTRALILNIGVLNQNLGLYGNIECLFEIDLTSNIWSTFRVRAFSPDTDEQSPFFVAVFLRIVLVLMLVALFSFELWTRIGSRRHPRGSLASSRTRGPASNSEVPSWNGGRTAPPSRFDESDEHGASDAISLSLYWRTAMRVLFGNMAMWLTAASIVAAVCSLALSLQYMRCQDCQMREVLITSTPDEAWNGALMFERYHSIAVADALVAVILSIKLTAWLWLGPGTAVWLKAASFGGVQLALAGTVYLIVVLAFSVSFLFLHSVSEQGDIASLADAFNLVLVASFHSGLQEGLPTSNRFAEKAVSFALISAFNLFGVAQFFGLGIGIWWYSYRYRAKLGALTRQGDHDLSQFFRSPCASRTRTAREGGRWSRFAGGQKEAIPTPESHAAVHQEFADGAQQSRHPSFAQPRQEKSIELVPLSNAQS